MPGPPTECSSWDGWGRRPDHRKPKLEGGWEKVRDVCPVLEEVYYEWEDINRAMNDLWIAQDRDIICVGRLEGRGKKELLEYPFQSRQEAWLESKRGLSPAEKSRAHGPGSSCREGRKERRREGGVSYSWKPTERPGKGY